MIEDVQVELSSAQPTVATLRWRTVEPATCRVTFGEPGAATASTPMEPEAASEHEAVLVGVPEEREIRYQIAAWTATGADSTREGRYTTGQLPPLAAELRVEGNPGQGTDGLTLLPVFTSPPGTDIYGQLDLVNPEGERLWARDAGLVARARLAPDGLGLVYLSAEADGTWLREVSWTGEVLWAVDVPSGQRDFAFLGEDTYAVLLRDARSVEGYAGLVEGDALALVHPDGSLETTWSVFDALGPGWCSDEHAFSTDWSHANHLTWLPDQGLLLIVLRSLPAIIAVEPFSGRQAWILSDVCSDFRWSDDRPVLVNPHSAEPTEAGLLVFDQGQEPNGCSGAMELGLDPDLSVVTPLWSWTGSCQHTYFMGNAQPLDGGDRLVAMNGAVFEVTPDGDEVSRLTSSIGAGFGYVLRVPGLYP